MLQAEVVDKDKTHICTSSYYFSNIVPVVM